MNVDLHLDLDLVPVMSHSFNVLSSDPDAIVFPSFEKATEYTESRCPSYLSKKYPVAASHTLTMRSSEPFVMSVSEISMGRVVTHRSDELAVRAEGHGGDTVFRPDVVTA